MSKQEQIDNLIDNQIDDLKLNSHYKNKLSKKEKIELLKSFLDDKTYFKSMKDMLSEEELMNYINDNIEIMVEKVGVK